SSVLSGVVETSANIPIPKAVERKLTPVDDGQKLGVRFPHGLERSVAPSAAVQGPAHLRCFLGQRSLHVDCCQGGQMSFGSCPTHFGPSVQIRHAAAPPPPAIFPS